MAKRVLGDDPFATPKNDKPEKPAPAPEKAASAKKPRAGSKKPGASAKPRAASTGKKPRSARPPKGSSDEPAEAVETAPPIADEALAEALDDADELTSVPPPADLAEEDLDDGLDGDDEGAVDDEARTRPPPAPEAVEPLTIPPPSAVPREALTVADLLPDAHEPHPVDLAAVTRDARADVAAAVDDVVAAAQQVVAAATEVVFASGASSHPAPPTDLDGARTSYDSVVVRADPAPDVDALSAAEEASRWPGEGEGEAPTDVEAAIRDIESRLDRLLRAAQQAPTVGEAKGTIERLAGRLREVAAERAGAWASPERPEDAAVVDSMRELLQSNYYLRQWGRVAMRDRAEETDEFGLDPEYEARFRPLFDFLYDRWWRVEVEDIHHVPEDGRVILVANHSGALPYDGVMLATALRREHPVGRQLRWLAEDFVFHFPFLGVFMNRLGAVRACQENAERLLRRDTCVGVFPEGVKGVSKLYRDRYRLQRFGRGGHIKLAIRTRTPIVPVTILGAEETHPLIMPSGFLGKLLGVPYLPITPTFPLLGPAGLVPLPSKWRIFFGEPLPMDGYSPDAADDEVLVGRLNEKLRGTIQDTLDRAIRARRGVFRG